MEAFENNKKVWHIYDQGDLEKLDKIKSVEYNIPSVYNDIFYLYRKYVDNSVNSYTTECSSCSRNIFSMYDVVITRLKIG